MINVTHFKHAYRQAPWRMQRQWAGIFLLGVLIFAMISALYLDVTSNAAIDGREIQQLRLDITATQRMNADLETELAVQLSTSNMEARARAMGFRPADMGEIQYLVVPGYVHFTGVNLAAAQTQMPAQYTVPPEYTQSLLDWLSAFLNSPSSGVAAGVLP